jgi:hypothetical protein
MAKGYIVDRAIDDAAFILEGIERRWPFGPFELEAQTSPSSIIALATLRKPAMFAPFTRFPGVPYASAVS